MTNIYRRSDNRPDQDAIIWNVRKPFSVERVRKNKGVSGSNRNNRKIERERTKLPQGIACVYVFEARDCCKVGISTNVILRRNNLEHARGETLRIAFMLKLAMKDAKKLESESHWYLKTTGCHMRGEWYRLSSEAAVAAIERVAENICVDIDSQSRYDGCERGS